MQCYEAHMKFQPWKVMKEQTDILGGKYTRISSSEWEEHAVSVCPVRRCVNNTTFIRGSVWEQQSDSLRFDASRLQENTLVFSPLGFPNMQLHRQTLKGAGAPAVWPPGEKVPFFFS